jgi:hypothetical protein
MLAEELYQLGVCFIIGVHFHLLVFLSWDRIS